MGGLISGVKNRLNANRKRLHAVLTSLLALGLLTTVLPAQEGGGPGGEPGGGPGFGGRGPRGRGGPFGEAVALPEGTKAFRDLAYVNNGHSRQKLDLYVPEQGGKFPLVIVIHGGGFMGGDKGHENVAQFLKAGYAAASRSITA